MAKKSSKKVKNRATKRNTRISTSPVTFDTNKNTTQPSDVDQPQFEQALENNTSTFDSSNKRDPRLLYLFGFVIIAAVISFLLLSKPEKNDTNTFQSENTIVNSLEVKPSDGAPTTQESGMNLQQSSNVQPAQTFTPEQYRNFQQTGEITR